MNCVLKKWGMTALALILLHCIVLSNGCAQKMALSPKMKSIDLSKKSIALVTVKVANDHVPGHQPKIIQAYFGPNSKKPTKYRFKTDKPFISEKKQYNIHLISVALPPGEYWMDNCIGTRIVPLLLGATCSLPVKKNFTLEANEIIYLGRIDAHIRKKEGSEKAAGGPFPLIDQAVAGFSSGTFDVDIFDNYEEDMQYFISKYPVIRDKIMTKDIME